jgi:ABC-type sugar transport system ATPase subunit
MRRCAAPPTLGIGARLERYPHELRRTTPTVAIGRAIVRDARLFLFDEPLSNLDAQLRDEMRTEIKRLHQRLGKTMIYVTHDQIEAMTLADRIVLLQDGVIEQQGAPLDLFERPATRFVAGFRSPAINFIPADHVSEGGAVSLRLGRPPSRLAAGANREPAAWMANRPSSASAPSTWRRPWRQRAAGLRCTRGGDRLGQPTGACSTAPSCWAAKRWLRARRARREPARRTRGPAV